MIQRTVASATNLHLLAHLWYGDYTRAGELKLLNPSLGTLITSSRETC
jgi:prophage DNA circulation protein